VTLIPLAPNASLLEVAWTLMALPGFGLSLYNTAGAWRDLYYHWRDGLRPLGWIGLAKVSIVLAMTLLIIAAGIAAMGVPEPVRPELQDAGELIAGCLVLLDVLTLALAIAFSLERAYVVPHIHMLRDRT
jgi:hypothetical protein